MKEDKNRKIPEDWKSYFVMKNYTIALLHALLVSGYIIDNFGIDIVKKPLTAITRALAKENPSEYMLNKARCLRKQHDRIFGVTKDYFLFMAKSSDFEVIGWDVRLIDTNMPERGFKYYIEGYHFIYRKSC